MKALVTLGMAVVFATVTIVSGADDAKAKKALDPTKILGDWTYEAGTKMGEMIDKARLAGTVIITKDAIHLPADGGQKFVMPYKLDATKSPAEVDMEIKEGPVGVGGKAKGILSLEGDVLKMCYVSEMGEEAKRPAKFESTKENKAHLFVLKKAKK